MDNLYLAMSNWLTLSIQSGFRIKEWTQIHSPLIIANNFKRMVDGTSTAFRTDNLILFSKGKKKMNTIKSLAQLKKSQVSQLSLAVSKKPRQRPTTNLLV